MSSANGIVHINKCCRTGLEVREIQASAEVCPGEVFAADCTMTISGNADLGFYVLKVLRMFIIYYKQLGLSASEILCERNLLL